MHGCFTQAIRALQVATASALLAFFCLLVCPTPAASGTLTIQYRITDAAIWDIPLPNPGGTYTVRVTATGPGTVVSGPATLLTLRPYSGLIPVLGVPGTAGPINFQSFSFKGDAYRTYTAGTGLGTASPYTGFYQRARHDASWYGLVDSGGTGLLDVKISFYSLLGDDSALHTRLYLASGYYIGEEINTTYAPEPATIPLVVSALMTLAAVAIARPRLRRS